MARRSQLFNSMIDISTAHITVGFGVRGPAENCFDFRFHSKVATCHWPSQRGICRKKIKRCNLNLRNSPSSSDQVFELINGVKVVFLYQDYKSSLVLQVSYHFKTLPPSTSVTALLFDFKQRTHQVWSIPNPHFLSWSPSTCPSLFIEPMIQTKTS